MTSLTDLIATNRAFADLAARVDADTPVHNGTWPTAGAMIDHLGNIQAWATHVVQAGVPADRKQYERPANLERADWLRQTGDALVETLETTDPARACWTLWDAEPVVAFWRRRMTNEAAKHLWDLRTAVGPEPLMPAEVSPAARAGVMDEFVDVLVPAARRRGIDPLPRDVLLVAEDLGQTWHFSRDWEVTAGPLAGTPSTGDADIMRADLGDIVLFVWQRADPWKLPNRFQIDGSDAALRAFARTPIHL